MTFEEWEQQVPEQIKRDPVWRFLGYRKALHLSDLAWEDTEKMLRDLRGAEFARQLIRSAGSIPANVEEGYGRGYGKDRDYFLRVALGSARETRGWYYRARHLLSEIVLEHRLNLCSEIVALLVSELETQRQYRATQRPEHS